MLSLIAAMAHQRVIGRAGGMPWHLPADLAWFRYHTWGKPVLMGRNTWLSLGGKALPGRLNIVISRSMTAQRCLPQGADLAASPEQALEKAQLASCDEVMVIGGAQIYQYFLPRADRLYLTQIDAALSGDTWFPDYQHMQWQQSEYIACQDDRRNPYPCTFIVLDRLA